MKKTIFLLSKDAMTTEYLPVYGNTFWKTPNIDELAKKGTVFYNHHTAGGSTAMAMSSMLTGKNPFEFKSRSRYTSVIKNEFLSIFDYLQKDGYDCHILWSVDYMEDGYDYIREFGDEEKTVIHVVDMHEPVGQHRSKGQDLLPDEERLDLTYNNIINELNSIEKKEKQFIWLHLPHVLKGRTQYGSDIDVLDKIVGFVRKRYGDDSIYFTADHGNMNFHKNISGYGFHVYEPTMKVPLITPRTEGKKKVEGLTSHVDLMSIILEDKITEREYVFCDTQYYAQPDRKLAVIGKGFKYIYNKRDNSEELYDLNWDKEENFNLLVSERYESYRCQVQCVKELYFYPYYDKAQKAYEFLKSKKDGIWRNGTKKEEFINKAKRFLREIKGKRIAKKQLKENEKK